MGHDRSRRGGWRRGDERGRHRTDARREVARVDREERVEHAAHAGELRARAVGARRRRLDVDLRRRPGAHDRRVVRPSAGPSSFRSTRLPAFGPVTSRTCDRHGSLAFAFVTRATSRVESITVVPGGKTPSARRNVSTSPRPKYFCSSAAARRSAEAGRADPTARARPPVRLPPLLVDGRTTVEEIITSAASRAPRSAASSTSSTRRARSP